MKITKKVEEFLKEYQYLCNNYGLYIHACGCCSSPFIVEKEEKHEIEEHINHLKKEYEEDC